MAGAGEKRSRKEDALKQKIQKILAVVREEPSPAELPEEAEESTPPGILLDRRGRKELPRQSTPLRRRVRPE